jgi:adenylate cyclase
MQVHIDTTISDPHYVKSVSVGLAEKSNWVVTLDIYDSGIESYHHVKFCLYDDSSKTSFDINITDNNNLEDIIKSFTVLKDELDAHNEQIIQSNEKILNMFRSHFKHN